MLGDRTFWAGVIVGLIIPLAYHKFVKPIPGGKGS